jgi:hypothetical protein
MVIGRNTGENVAKRLLDDGMSARATYLTASLRADNSKNIVFGMDSTGRQFIDGHLIKM